MPLIIADRVRDTTTTTSTGPLALADAPPTGYQSFGAVCANADTIWYCIQHQTLNEWEVGLGTSDGTTTLTRTTVYASSAAGAPVNFSAGTKEVFAVLPAAEIVHTSDVLEILTDDRTYYVRSDGDDANTGLVDSSGGAFASIQQAVNAAMELIWNNNVVSIEVGAGTFGGCTISGPPTAAGTGWLEINGDIVTPSNCILSQVVEITNMPYVGLYGFKTQATNYAFKVGGGSYVGFGDIIFNGAQYGVYADGFGIAVMEGNCEMLATSAYSYFFNAGVYGYIRLNSGKTFTCTGSPSFTVFAAATKQAFIEARATFVDSGTEVGTRYISYTNSAIDTGGGGEGYFPGDGAGDVGSDCSYV